MPSRPTLTRLASSVPSSFFTAPKMMILEPVFTSDLAPAKTGPSTISMVPRIRTVGACCVHATDVRMAMAATAAESGREIDELIFGMISLQKCCADLSAQTPQAGGYSASLHSLLIRHSGMV